MSERIIECGRQAAPADCFVAGWAAPETGHRWTLGTESRLRLGPLPAEGGLLVKLDLFPHLPAGLDAQRLAVAVNGTPVGAFAVDRNDTYTCIVPAALVAGRAVNLIAFEHPDAVCPAEAPGTGRADRRSLAIGFLSIRLESLADAPSDGGHRLVVLAGRGDAREIRRRLAGTAQPVKDVQSLAALDAVLSGDFGATRLLACCSPVIVPAALLERAGRGAYNIHPGPPAYPGTHPCAFAAYDGTTRFGATLHEMAARVDSGAIVDVERIDVPPEAGVGTYGAAARAAVAGLLDRWLVRLAADPAPLPPAGLGWGPRKSTHRQLLAMRRVEPGIAAEEFARRRRAFADSAGDRLVLDLHGREFVFTRP